MSNHRNFSKMQCVYKCRQVVRIHYCRVAVPWRIHIGIVVSSTIGDCAIMLCKRRDLIGPITAIAQRSVNKDHGHAGTLSHIVECDTVSNAGRMDLRVDCVFLRKAAAGMQPEDCSKNQNAKIDGTDSWHYAPLTLHCCTTGGLQSCG